MDLTTPALLFSAISLILLAYTNRFLSLAQLVRNLHDKYKQAPNPLILGQINNLRKRLNLIRTTQIAGLLSLQFCVISMFLFHVKQPFWGELTFAFGLILLCLSLVLSIWEIQISVKALNLHLSDIEGEKKNSGKI